MSYGCKSPVGNGVSKPEIARYPKGMQKNVSLSYDGGINQSASTVNLSAKFKNPQVKQDVPPEARNQYEQA